jgi:hypothetical protein
VLDLKRATWEARTLRQLGLLFIAHKLVVHLQGMARIAEVRRAPAEPLGDRTAELTLELYVVDAMLCTVFNPCPDTFGGALAADKILLLVVFCLILLLCINYAIFQTTEIWLLAFEALVVSAFEDGQPLKIVEKPPLRL